MTSPRARIRRCLRSEYLWAFCILGVLTAIFFNPVVRSGGSYSSIYAHQRLTYPWVQPGAPRAITAHDQPDYVYPRQVFVDRSLKNAHDLPLWDPLSFGGHPFFAESGSRLAYPPYLLLTLAASPIWVHDIYLMLHVLGAGMAAFALMKQLGTRFGGAMLTATAWAFSSYALLYYELEMYAAVAALLPLVVLFLWRWYTRRSWSSLLAGSLVLGVLYLGSSADLSFVVFMFALALSACLALHRLWRDWQEMAVADRIAVAVAPGVFVVAATAVAGVAILPFLQLSGSADTASQSVAALLRAYPPLDISSFLHTLVPPRAPLSVPAVSEQVFLGTATAVLALVGALSRRPGSGIGRSVVVVVALIAVGGPVSWTAYHVVPGLARLHGIGRAMFIFDLGLAMLGGIGLDVVLRTPRARPRTWTVLTASVTIVCLASVFVQLFHYGRAIKPPFQPRNAASLLPPTPATEATATALGEGRGRGRMVVMFDLGVPSGEGYALPGSTPMALDLPAINGYEPVVPARTAAIWRAMAGTSIEAIRTTKLANNALNAAVAAGVARTDLLARLGVRAVLGPPLLSSHPGWDPMTAGTNGLRVIYQGDDGVVYAVEGASPRAFVVNDAVRAHGSSDALARFVSHEFDARRQVVLEDTGATVPPGTVGPGPAAPSTVTWAEDGADHVRLSVDSTEAGWLVLLDSWGPGWEADVNGKATRIRHADYGFRAVPVKAGRSTVTFSYHPAPVIVGAWISVLTTTGIVGCLAVGRVRRRRHPGRPGPEPGLCEP